MTRKGGRAKGAGVVLAESEIRAPSVVLVETVTTIPPKKGGAPPRIWEGEAPAEPQSGLCSDRRKP